MCEVIKRLKIAILSSEKHCNKICEDILLKESLINKFSFDAEIIPWETANFDAFKTIIIRSVWGYHRKSETFFEKLKAYQNQGGIIINDLKIMKFINSKYNQYTLCSKLSIPYVETQKLKDLKNNFNFPIVVKPTISASGENTHKVDSALELDNIVENDTINCEKNNFYIVQPYIKGIEFGEKSYIFIDGEFKYAVNRFPGVLIGQKKIEMLKPKDVDTRVLSYGKIICDNFKSLAFLRLDVVYQNGIPNIMEIEAIDPDLFIRNISDENFKMQVVDSLSNTILKRILKLKRQ